MLPLRRKHNYEQVILWAAVEDDGVEREIGVVDLLLGEHLAVTVLDLGDCLAALHLEVEDGEAFVLVGREMAGEQVNPTSRRQQTRRGTWRRP